MAHGDVGLLMAYLDGELAPGESGAVVQHLQGCQECKDVVAALSAQKERLRAVLRGLDVDSTAVADRTANRLRARRATRVSALPPVAPLRAASPTRRWGPSRRQLLQAALFVLFLAGGVSALVPGSPLHRLIVGAPQTPAPEGARVPAAAPQPMQAEAAPELRVRAGAAQGSLRVSLQLASGSELRVTLVDGDSAAVIAPVGATVTGAGGLLEANAPTGPVRVELPRGLADVSLEVGGRLYLRATGGQLEVSAPTVERTQTTASFRIP